MKNSPSMRVRLAWGRKRADGEERAPPLPPLPVSDVAIEVESSVAPYPFLYIYDSPEVSIQHKTLRNRDKTVSLPPIPPRPQTT